MIIDFSPCNGITLFLFILDPSWAPSFMLQRQGKDERAELCIRIFLYAIIAAKDQLRASKRTGCRQSPHIFRGRVGADFIYSFIPQLIVSFLTQPK